MGSIQQIAMAAVCLVAAFAFGSFINQAPNQPSNQTALESSDQLRSLMDQDLPVHKSPAKTPLLQTLSPRLPMPSITDGNLFPSQTVNPFGLHSSSIGDIPPPNDLTGRITLPADNSATVLIAPDSTTVATHAPTFGSDSRGKASMPTVTPQKFGSSPNLADSMRAPVEPDFDDQSQPPTENAPVFVAAEYTDTETLPPSRNSRSEPYITSKPRLRSIEPTPEFALRPTRPQAPATPFENSAPIASPPFRRGLDHTGGSEQSRSNGLMPIPRVEKTVTITDPGGAFGNRDTQPDWRHTGKAKVANNASEYYPEANRHRPTTQQHRVTRLPLQLNSNAKSKLARLRDNTIQKISLSTTQFSEHVVERGDSLQSIASEYFGKPDFYLDIYLANRDRLRYPGDIREGMTLKIPIYQ